MTESKLIDIDLKSPVPLYHKQSTQWLFPVPIFGYGLPNCKDINKNIENRIYEKAEEEKTRKASNEGGWHSDGSMHDDTEMEPIIKFIEWAVRDLSVESKWNIEIMKYFFGLI